MADLVINSIVLWIVLNPPKIYFAFMSIFAVAFVFAFFGERTKELVLIDLSR